MPIYPAFASDGNMGSNTLFDFPVYSRFFIRFACVVAPVIIPVLWQRDKQQANLSMAVCSRFSHCSATRFCNFDIYQIWLFNIAEYLWWWFDVMISSRSWRRHRNKLKKSGEPRYVCSCSGEVFRHRSGADIPALICLVSVQFALFLCCFWGVPHFNVNKYRFYAKISSNARNLQGVLRQHLGL